jgi:hypothetical protein
MARLDAKTHEIDRTLRSVSDTIYQVPPSAE